MTLNPPHIGSTTGTPDVSGIWNTAVLRYEAITNIKIQSLARPKNVDEILLEITQTERKFASHRHDGSKLDRFRISVKNSLATIDVWGDIVTNATKTLFPPAEVIYAAARYLISTANAVSADYDRIEEFFESLGSYLRQLRIWEPKVPPIPELEAVITEVFTSVLVLCGICAKYVKMKRLVKAFRTLAGEDDELKAAFDHFRKMVQREEGIVRNAILADVQHLKLETGVVLARAEENLVVTERIDHNTDIIVADAGRIHQYLETQETAHERDNILTWLSSLNFLQKQRDIFAKYHNGTGTRFLNTEKFQQWFNGAQNSTLWCPGIPGAGKTVMTSAAITHVEEHTKRAEVAIAYVYCDYKDPKTQSEAELISSIARQLAEQCHPIPPQVKAWRDRWIEKRSYPTDDDRISLVKDISRLFKKTFVFVDALDECPERNWNNFLRLAKELEPLVRLFIASRPHLALDAKFVNLSRMDIVACDPDIQCYLESEISTNNRLSLFTSRDPTLKTQILDSVTGKADGMFLLAHLQMGVLCSQSSAMGVRESLRTLPTKIYDFYEDAIQRIEDQPEDDKQLAKRALAYIYCARRPLQLEELRHALSVRAGETELEQTGLPEVEIVLNISAGLIRVDEKSNATTLVHHTLQEYLEKNPSKLLPRLELEIATACLIYLSFDAFKTGPCDDGRALAQRLQKYRFLDYAAQYWGSHVMHNQLDEGTDLLFNFLESEEKLASAVQVLHVPRNRLQDCHDRFPKQFGPLHIVAFWGLDEVLPVLCEEGMDINSQDSYGTTPLQLAARHGHLTVVRLLLERGADVDISSNRKETAIYWAARNGHKTIVESLIANQADIMVEDSEGWTALDWAIIGGHTELAKLLLDCCSNVDPEYDGRDRALILAAEAGTEVTVKMLLDIGAEVNWKDRLGSTALTWAVPGGHVKVVRTLLENGADVNSRDVYHNTPLHWALPHEMIARLLLEKGANANAKNKDGQTPLIWAAQDGQEKALIVLLQNKADVKAKDRYGFTALHAAAIKGHEAIARVLLENGANPEEKDEDGWTPLHVAALKQHRELVRLLLGEVKAGGQIMKWVTSQQKDPRMWASLAEMAEKKSVGSTAISGLRSAAQDGHVERVQALLEKGADIDAEDACGSTALTLATWLERERIVRLLVEKGADVNRRERSGHSALHFASEDGNLEIIRLLVENGADVNAKIHEWTPMLIAAKKGHMWTVEYLIQEGAYVNAEDYDGRRALHWTARHGQLMTLQLLIDKGADFHAADCWGRTALVWAVESRELTIAKFLLEIGADVDSKTRDETTALHLASYLGDEKMVYLLLQRGASIEATTRSGFRPLHIAALLGHEQTVQLLLKDGADFDAEIQWSKVDDGYHDNGQDMVDDSWDGIYVGNDGRVPGTAMYLDKRLCQWLLKQKGQAQAPQSWTARQLAIRGGNLAEI